MSQFRNLPPSCFGGDVACMTPMKLQYWMVQVTYYTHGCMICTQEATNVCQLSVHSSGLLTFDIALEAELGQTVDCRSHPR